MYGDDPEPVLCETVNAAEQMVFAGFMLNTNKSQFVLSSLNIYNVGGGFVRPDFTQW